MDEADARFLKAFDEGNPLVQALTDDEFVSQAVLIFCIEMLKQEPETVAQKAATVIAHRLMATPKDREAWQVSFPYPFFSKEAALSDKEKEHRAIAYEVQAMIAGGAKVTHACARVAVARHSSPQKVTTAYYAWRDYLEKMFPALFLKRSQEK